MGIFGSKNKTYLNVEGMTCGHCVMRVTKALEEVDGVKTVNVSLDKKEVEVIFKGDKIGEDVLISAVENAGYKANVK